ncbi:Os10g0190900, partial [Oryza sativa Japonica Group]
QKLIRLFSSISLQEACGNQCELLRRCSDLHCHHEGGGDGGAAHRRQQWRRGGEERRRGGGVGGDRDQEAAVPRRAARRRHVAAERRPDDFRHVRRPPRRARPLQRLHGHLLRRRHRLQLAGWHGEQPGHAVRPGVRREAAPHARRVQAAGDAGARAGERPDRGGLGLHRRDPPRRRPGPGDRGGRRELHPVDDPDAVRLRAAAVPRPVPADAERRRAGDALRRRDGGEPRARLLAARAQARAGRQGRRARQRRLLPHQPLRAGHLRLATRVVMLLAFLVGTSEGLVMVIVRNLWGYAYSNEEEVADYIAKMMPILAVSILFDAIQCVLSGVVRGCGRQQIGAFINLGAYYLAGIPVAFFFAFVCHLGGMGLWFGILCGLVVQMLLLLTITLCTNWDKEALKAKDRVCSSSLPKDLAT